jgi:predicted aconitase
MRLTDMENAMLDGAEGPAVQKAMDLLVRYGEALGAERLVETNNVAGTVSIATPGVQRFLGPSGSPNKAYSQFNLDSDETVDIPPMRAFTCQLIHGLDPRHAGLQGLPGKLIEAQQEGEEFFGSRGVQMMGTCTPYQVGNVPVKGEHCAWMESSAVVYCNAVLGGRTNTEGRESTGAASLTGRIPYWGYHIPENRHARQRVILEIDIDCMMDWGLLGYYLGGVLEEETPVLDGLRSKPNLIKLKHFGAAAASSGGVEMYHIPGVTAEAASVEEALGGKRPEAEFAYGEAQRRLAYDYLNSTATSDDIDFVMLGCPHNSIEQMWLVARLLEGRHISPNTQLWVHTPRGIYELAERTTGDAAPHRPGDGDHLVHRDLEGVRLPPEVRADRVADRDDVHPGPVHQL